MEKFVTMAEQIQEPWLIVGTSIRSHTLGKLVVGSESGMEEVKGSRPVWMHLKWKMWGSKVQNLRRERVSAMSVWTA